MPIEPPRTLADLAAVSDPAARAQAARAYIEQREKAIREAIAIRDTALRLCAERWGPTETMRRTGYSLSTIKTARKAPG